MMSISIIVGPHRAIASLIGVRGRKRRKDRRPGRSSSRQNNICRPRAKLPHQVGNCRHRVGGLSAICRLGVGSVGTLPTSSRQCRQS